MDKPKRGRPRKYTPEQARLVKSKQSSDWNKKHKETATRRQLKSKAKNFLTKKATAEELIYFEKLVKERLKELDQ